MTTDITELAQRLKLEVHRALSDFPPEVNGKYLVITSYGDIRTACYDCESGEWRASDGTITGVIKWMELPAAPQGVGDA
ncbi:hypothetical protein ABLV51_05450 [Klebsiella sp. GB_Kp051]|uniref:hypothetical protein n=1 Tax=Klebsiella sp. GB_Kp051 TaxID=3153402 RepID=UPI0032B62887